MTSPLDELRAAFPVADRWVYLNHAAVCPLPEPVRRAVVAFVDEAAEHGSTGWADWLARREHVRGKAARLLGAADADEVGFVTSTSQGILTVAEGLDWRAGDEVVVIDHDFPANLIPWHRQARRRGVRVVTVPRADDGTVSTDAVLSAVTERTRVVAVPWVLYDSGARLDLVTLGAALADHPALFFVDAIQGVGAFPIDVRAARIDALSADSHKWMLGLEGIGLLYVRAEVLDRLDPPFESWLSVVDPFEPYEPGKALVTGTRRFEYGALPTAEIFGLEASLDLLLSTGVERIAERVLALTAQLIDGLGRRGWHVVTPHHERALRSGIVVAVPPGGADAHDVVHTLEERRVSVTPRGGGVRFSPHGWNTAEEIDRALEALP